MGCLNKLRVDSAKSTEGVWVPFAEGIEVKIARMNNPEFVRYYAEISESHLRQLRRRTGVDDKAADLMKDAVAHCIIKDWRNLQDDKGKEIKYTPEKALELISDEANLIFYDFILDASSSFQLFFEQNKAESAKN